MAKKFSKAQIAAGFGGKRRKSAAKASRAKKRNRPKAKARHRPRTKPNAPKKRRRTAPVATAPKKRRKRKNGSAKKRVQKRKNTGALYALVNPAGRKNKVARTKKRKSPRKRSAGSTKKRSNRGRRVAHRRNAGAMGKPADWLALGSGAIVGGLGATSLPQMLLGASNTGPMGYLGMAAATAVLATAGHFLFKKNTMLTSGIVAGGAGAIIKRIIGDYTPYGQYLNQVGAAGMGDYLSGFNFSTPQIIGGNGNTSLGAAGTIPVSVAGAGSMNSRALMNI